MPSYKNRFGSFIEIAGKSKEESYKKLLTQYSVLFDDRDKTFNNKINQCTSIGIPIALIVGKTISIKFKDQIHNCDNIDQAYELINYLYSSSY